MEVENENVKNIRVKIEERNELLQMQVDRSEMLLEEFKDLLERQTAENEALKEKHEEERLTYWSPRSDSPDDFVIKTHVGMQCGAPGSTMVEQGFQTDQVLVHKEYLDELKEKECERPSKTHIHSLPLSRLLHETNT